MWFTRSPPESALKDARIALCEYVDLKGRKEYERPFAMSTDFISREERQTGQRQGIAHCTMHV